MEKLEKRIDQLQKAILTLDEAIKKFEAAKNSVDHAFARDSLIKRFEYCTDILWKVLKDYLEKVYGLVVKAPKDVYRREVGFLNEQESQSFLNMVDDRNQTSHTYDEIFAEEMSDRIIHHYSLMNKTLQKLNQSI